MSSFFNIKKLSRGDYRKVGEKTIEAPSDPSLTAPLPQTSCPLSGMPGRCKKANGGSAIKAPSLPPRLSFSDLPSAKSLNLPRSKVAGKAPIEAPIAGTSEAAPATPQLGEKSLPIDQLAMQLVKTNSGQGRYRLAKAQAENTRTALEEFLLPLLLDCKQPLSERERLIKTYCDIQRARLGTKSAEAKAAHDAKNVFKRMTAGPEARRIYNTESARPEYETAVANLADLRRQLTRQESAEPTDLNQPKIASGLKKLMDGRVARMSALIGKADLRKIEPKVELSALPAELLDQIMDHVLPPGQDPLLSATYLAKLERVHPTMSELVDWRRRGFKAEASVSLAGSKAALAWQRKNPESMDVGAVVRKYPYVEFDLFDKTSVLSDKKKLLSDKTSFLSRMLPSPPTFVGQLATVSKEDLAKNKHIAIKVPEGSYSDSDKEKLLAACKNLNSNGNDDLVLSLALSYQAGDAKAVKDLVNKTLALENPKSLDLTLERTSFGLEDVAEPLLAEVVNHETLKSLSLIGNGPVTPATFQKKLQSEHNKLVGISVQIEDLDATGATVFGEALKHVNAQGLQQLHVQLDMCPRPHGNLRPDGVAFSKELKEALVAPSNSLQELTISNMNTMDRAGLDALVQALTEALQSPHCKLRSLSFQPEGDARNSRTASGNLINAFFVKQLVEVAGRLDCPLEVLDLRPYLWRDNPYGLKDTVEEALRQKPQLRILSGRARQRG